jgi:hypothetical protein
MFFLSLEGRGRRILFLNKQGTRGKLLSLKVFKFLKKRKRPLKLEGAFFA